MDRLDNEEIGIIWARHYPKRAENGSSKIALLVGDKPRRHAVRSQVLRLHFRRQRFGLRHRSAMRQAFMAEKNHSGNIARKRALFISASIGIERKKAAPDNSARMVLARQRLIYYRRCRADHTDQSDQPARTTSQSFFNRRQVVGFQAERPQGIQIPPNSG